jgi:hypothetical protein
MRVDKNSRENLPGLALALVAGLHKAILVGAAGNDDYQHLVYAQQILARDLPLRDFWDLSTTLQDVISAASQLVFGHRLLAEAIIVGLATAVAVFLVFRVIRTLTGSAAIAIVCAALFIVAVPRTYSYPKWLVYAGAAWLWWNYLWWPSTRKAVLAGASVAVAFYWRHDHGLLVAIGVAIGMIAAHGWTRDAARRTAIAGVVAFLAVLPYLAFAAAVLGPVDVAELELASFTDEQVRTRSSQLHWPLRTAADYVGVKPAEWYAPEIIIRWKPDLAPDARAALLEKYDLTPTADEGSGLERVRLSARSLGMMRELVDDPQIDDTSRMDRASGTFSRAQWPLIDRALFRLPLLRVKPLPGIDRPFDAGLAAAVAVHVIPLLVVLLLISPIKQRLPPAVPARALLLFVLFVVIVNVGLVREPYGLRVTEALVLPVILLAVILATLLLPLGFGPARWPAWLLAAGMMLLIAKSLAVAGEFGMHMRALTGAGQQSRANATWRQMLANLEKSPPSRLRGEQTELPTARLADYVRRCVASRDRILVLWYAPEIHYESERLMAGRHLYFFIAFADVEGEQRRELEKVMRFKPPIVLTNTAESAAVRRAFPALVRYVESNYVTGAAFDDAGARYSILIRRDSAPPALDQTTGWPCYA